MPTQYKRHSLLALALTAVGLSGCSQDETLADFGVETNSPVICKAPETLTEDGTGCELVLSACTFPEVPDELGLCVMFEGEWPDGANDIVMPDPVYTAQARAGGGYEEVVYYYNRPEGDFEGWGLHAWNNSDCASYSEFAPDGGTDWGIGIVPLGEDPNFGIYWALGLVDNPNCTNFIPYGFEINDDGSTIQTSDLSVDVSSEETNPTGNFYVLARSQTDADGPIFAWPRTYASLEVPGGGTVPTVECELPQTPNEDSTECLDPVIGEFTPGEVALYLRGGFNDWGTEENLSDATAFHYEEGIYTYTMTIAPNPDSDNGSYEFKIADVDWTDATSFGVAPGSAEERAVVLGEAIPLLTGKLANDPDADVEANIVIVPAEETSYQFVINATVPESPTLTVTEVPLDKTVFIRGSMNSWGNDEEGNFSLDSGVAVMSYQGENQYSGRLVLEASDTPYEFKIADAAWTAELNYGTAADDQAIDINVEKTLTTDNGQNIQFTVTDAGAYLLTMDVTDPAAPTLVVRSAIPYGETTVYFRGSPNDWVDPPAESQAFTYEGEGIYTHITSLDAADHFFKVASADWDAVNFGAENPATDIVEGEPLTLVRPGENITIPVTEAADFLFHLDANLRESPVLTVRNLQTFGEETIYLRGSLNGWADPALETEAMTYAGKGIYAIQLDLAASEDPYNFKIASEAWEGATVDLGGVSEEEAALEPGTPEALATGGANLTLTVTEETAGLYSFTLDTTDAEAPVLNVFKTAELYLRGSMNEWADPPTQMFTTENGVDYTIQTELASGEHFFKVAAADWGAGIEYAAPAEDTSVTIGVTKSLSAGGENISLDTTDAAGTYQFDFRLASPQDAKITVTPVE